MTYRSKYVRQQARSVLEMVGIAEPPVDVHRIAKTLGFLVLTQEFPDDTSAILYIEGDVKGIGVNGLHAPTRQRFSLAHELGHYLSGHEDFGGGERIHVDSTFDYSDPQQRQEMEANEFAAELLMPEPMLRRDLGEFGLDAVRLAKRYEVSEQAMWIQLIDLKLAAQYSST